MKPMRTSFDKIFYRDEIPPQILRHITENPDTLPLKENTYFYHRFMPEQFWTEKPQEATTILPASYNVRDDKSSGFFVEPTNVTMTPCQIDGELVYIGYDPDMNNIHFAIQSDPRSQPLFLPKVEATMVSGR